MRAPAAMLMIAIGCSRSPSEAERAAEILAQHRAADLHPSGAWTADGAVLVVSIEKTGGLSVQGVADGIPTRDEAAAVFEDGTLTLSAPVLGSSRYHLCRFSGEELLLPDQGVRLVEGTMPTGRVFKRLEPEMLEPETLYLPGPEDENRPMRRGQVEDY